MQISFNAAKLYQNQAETAIRTKENQTQAQEEKSTIFSTTDKLSLSQEALAKLKEQSKDATDNSTQNYSSENSSKEKKRQTTQNVGTDSKFKPIFDQNGIDTSHDVDLVIYSDGRIKVTNDHPDKAKIETLLNNNATIGDSIRYSVGVLA